MRNIKWPKDLEKRLDEVINKYKSRNYGWFGPTRETKKQLLTEIIETTITVTREEIKEVNP